MNGAVVAVAPIIPVAYTLVLVGSLLAAMGVAAIRALRSPQTARRALAFVWRQRTAILVVAVMAAAVAFSSRRLRRGDTRVADAQPGGSSRDEAADWPTDRGSLARLGVVSGSIGPASSRLRWSHSHPREAFFSSPTIHGDRVYAIGSRGDRGRLYCLDARTGRELWSSGGLAASISSPVIAGDLLLCGEGVHQTTRARVRCFDLRPGHAGDTVWEFVTAGHVECTPVVDGHRVYFGAGDDGLYCVRLDGRQTPDVLWHLRGPRYPDVETALAVHEGRVYAGLGIGGNGLCVLDAESGSEIDRVAFPYPIFCPPTIHDGKIFLGMGHGDYVTPQRRAAGQVVCLDLGSLQVQWTFATSGSVLGAIACHDDRLFFGCADGHVYQLDRNGREISRWNSHAPIIASPAVTSRFVYVVNQDGWLYALRRPDMHPVWERRLGNPGMYASSPTVSGGGLWVGSAQEGLICIAADSDPPPPRSVWPGYLGGAGSSGCRDQSTLPRDPRLAWSLGARLDGDTVAFEMDEGDSSRDETSCEVRAPVAVAGPMIVVPVRARDRGAVVCLDRAVTGHGRIPAIRWHQQFDQPIECSPLIVGNRVAVVEGARNGTGDNGPKTLHGLELTSGRRLWSRPVFLSPDEAIVADDESIILATKPDLLVSYSWRGDENWRAETGPTRHAAATSGGLLVAANDRGELLALDRLTGRVLWHTRGETAPSSAPVIIDREVLIGTSAGLEIRSLVDGRLVDRSPRSGGAVASRLVIAGDECIFVNDRGNLVAYHRSDGRLDSIEASAQLHAPNRGAGPPGALLLATRDAILVRTVGETSTPTATDRPATERWSLFRGPPWSLQTDAWLPSSQLTPPTSPAVLADGDVYIGMRGRGLVCLREGAADE